MTPKTADTGRLAATVFSTARRFAEREIVVDRSGDGPPRRVSYADLLDRACALARELDSLGLEDDGRIVISGANSPGWIAAFLGAHFTGRTVCPLDPELGDEELGNILSFLRPSLVICDRGLRERFAGAGAPLIEIASIGSGGRSPDYEPRPLPADRPLSIVFTSGSTARPKGVMLTESNFLHNVDLLTGISGLVSQRDRVLNLLPLHHVYAFTITLTMLRLGTAVIYPRSLKGPDIMEAAREERATIIVVVPRVLQAIHKRIFGEVGEKPLIKRLAFRAMLKAGSAGIERGLRPGRLIFRRFFRSMPALRLFACGGARLEENIHRELACLGFRIIEAYGLSETAPIVTINDFRRPVFGSVGKPAGGVEVRLERLDPGLDEKELLVRGPNVMPGYWNNEEQTRKAFVDGWFRTGDLAHRDSEGNIFLSGRSKEVIVLPSGKNIYPEELEKTYMRRCTLAEEICICMLDDSEGRGRLTAVVVPSRDALRKKQAASIYEEIRFEIEGAAARLPSYQRVNEVVLRDEPFPRTRLGKLRRYRIVEDIHRERESSGADSLSGEEDGSYDDPLLEFAAARLDYRGRLTGRENLERDLGLDSLGKLEFISSFEKHFGVVLTDEQAGSLVTLGELRQYIGAGSGTAGREAVAPPPLDKLVYTRFGPFGATLRLVSRLALGLVVRILFRPRVSGLEHLPRGEAYILAPRHLSYVDGLVLHAVLPMRESLRMFSVATAHVFDLFPFSLLTYHARVIKTGTLGTAASSLEYAREVFRRGWPLMLFPEGKRAVEPKVDTPKPGIAHLARECGVKVVPVNIIGAEKVLSRSHPGFRPARLEVEFIEPLEPDLDSREILESWQDAIRRRDER